MLKRTLFFSSPGRLYLKQSLLAYRQTPGETETAAEGGSRQKKKKGSKAGEGEEETLFPEERTFPLEDVGLIVLESLRLTVTTACLNALASANIALVICDSSHMPSAMLQAYSGHTLTQRHTEAQLQASAGLKARLWRQTVQAKIRNQAECLRRLGLPDSRLRVLSKAVKAGDAGNAEAVAARYYFQQLSTLALRSGNSFLRDPEGDAPNPALNYGYAILRAAVARALTGSGLFCAAGIHHSNQYNAFGLADDVMEPFRAFVDEAVFSSLETFSVAELGKDQKAPLLRLLAADVQTGGEKRPLLNSITLATASLVRCFLGEEKAVRYPEFVRE